MVGECNMAKWKFEGLNAYVTQLKTLENGAESAIKKAVYTGADIVANSIRAKINALPVERTPKASSGKLLTGVTKLEKKGLLDGFGISTFQDDDGYINVKMGFHGYNQIKTKKYPKGQPNAMIARSVVRGTSVRIRIPFVANATRHAKGGAEEQMRKVLDEEIRAQLKKQGG